MFPQRLAIKLKTTLPERLVFAYGPKTGAAFWRFFPLLFAVLRNGLLHNTWGGGVGCNDILELAHMVDATVNLLTWLMLRNMMGRGGWGMMLTFLELAYMVDATQHDGVGWVGNDVNT